VEVVLKQQICGPKLPKTQQIDQIARIQNGYFWWKFSISQEQEKFGENDGNTSQIRGNLEL
jgi:hypothetical protein